MDDDPRTLLYELWIEQKIPNHNWAGEIDANSVFATVGNGSNFLNSSMGYRPTILELPTYPVPRSSANVIYDNGRRSGAAGVFASDGAGLLWLAEIISAQALYRPGHLKNIRNQRTTTFSKQFSRFSMSFESSNI